MNGPRAPAPGPALPEQARGLSRPQGSAGAPGLGHSRDRPIDMIEFHGSIQYIYIYMYIYIFF